MILEELSEYPVLDQYILLHDIDVGLRFLQ